MRSLVAIVIVVVLTATSNVVNSASCDSDTPRACPRNYQPVCATFIKTFSNRCVLESALCSLAKDGFEFTEESRSGDCCFRPMTLELNYQCGSDGKVYPSPGSLAHARCEKNDWIRSVDPSNCPDFPEPFRVPEPVA